jgi:hypothetical protein
VSVPLAGYATRGNFFVLADAACFAKSSLNLIHFFEFYSLKAILTDSILFQTDSLAEDATRGEVFALAKTVVLPCEDFAWLFQTDSIDISGNGTLSVFS